MSFTTEGFKRSKVVHGSLFNISLAGDVDCYGSLVGNCAVSGAGFLVLVMPLVHVSLSEQT